MRVTAHLDPVEDGAVLALATREHGHAKDLKLFAHLHVAFCLQEVHAGDKRMLQHPEEKGEIRRRFRRSQEVLVFVHESIAWHD